MCADEAARSSSVVQLNLAVVSFTAAYLTTLLACFIKFNSHFTEINILHQTLWVSPINFFKKEINLRRRNIPLRMPLTISYKYKKEGHKAVLPPLKQSSRVKSGEILNSEMTL